MRVASPCELSCSTACALLCGLVFTEVCVLACQRCVVGCLKEHVPGLSVVDASCVCSEALVQQRLHAGVDIRLLADYVRARHLEAVGGGLFIDGDTLWIRPLARCRP